MAVNRISGNILQDNLQRGANLSIQGNLAFFDVINSRVGILTSSPLDAFEVAGNLRVGNIVLNLSGNIDAGNNNINNLAEPVVNTDAATKFYVDSFAANANIGNFSFSANTISLSGSPGNITIAPTGNGILIIDTVSGLAIPASTTVDRPALPPAGTIRYNTTTGYIEVFDGVGWDSLQTAGSTVINNQTITPDGSTSSYTLDQSSTSAGVLVTFNGVTQTPDTTYSVIGNTITFTEPPLGSDIIQIRFLAGTIVVDYITNSSGNAIVRADGSGNITLQSTGYVNVTGDISATGNITADYVLGNGSQLTGLNTYGNSNVALYLDGSVGNIIPAANVTYSLGNSTSQWKDLWISNSTIYINSVPMTVVGNTLQIDGQPVLSSGSDLSVSTTGNITAGNISVATGTVSVGNIVNNNGNAVGNIGSSSSYFNTVFATATTALYADLAEKFTSDSDYDPGTVVKFGGNCQVTISNAYADHCAAGIVSTNPAHLMNSGLAEMSVDLALAGQVPCQVVGPVNKGDILTTADLPGYACRLIFSDWKPGCIIAKSLEDCGPGLHRINVVVSS